jgi:hypothetical protein
VRSRAFGTCSAPPYTLLDDAPYDGVTRSREHGDRPVHIREVGGEGILDGPQHGTVGDQVEKSFTAGHGLPDSVLVGHAGDDQLGCGVHLVAPAREEIIEHAHLHVRRVNASTRCDPMNPAAPVTNAESMPCF